VGLEYPGLSASGASGGRMRFVLVFLAALAATQAFAQPTDKPLPPPPVILEFLRTTFGAMFGDLTAITPQGGPGLFRATTSSADLPQFDLRLAERESPESDTDKEVDAVLGPTRSACYPWRYRGEVWEPVRLHVMTMLCPGGSEQQLAWMMQVRNDTIARTIVVLVPVGQSAALLARSDRQMAALKITPAVQARNLAEAVIIAHVHSGFEYLHELHEASVPTATSAVLRVKDLTSSGKPGTYEAEAPNCGAITVREITEGPPRFVNRETRIDLHAVRKLISREGINLRARAGSYGQSTRVVAARPDDPIRMEEIVEEGLLLPDAIFYPTMDSYLYAFERFCSGAVPASAQTPAATAPAAVVAQAPAAVQTPAANAQAPAATTQASAGPIRTLAELPQGVELDRLVEQLVRSFLPGATVARANRPSSYNITANGRQYAASLVSERVRQPGDRDFSDQGIARFTQLSSCEAPRRLSERVNGDVTAVSWSAECPKLLSTLFVGVFHDPRQIQMLTLVGIGVDRASIERTNAIMAQPFAFKEMAAGNALDTMEERAAFFAFFGLRRDGTSGVCKAPNVSRSADGRTLTFVSKCDDAPEWTQTVTIERRSACRYAYTLEHDMPHMEEREEGELNFTEVDWGGIQIAGDMVSAEKALPNRLSYRRGGPRAKPTSELRLNLDQTKVIQVDGLDVPNFAGQWNAIVQAFRAECPGRG